MNEFGRDTRVVPSNSVLERGLGPHGKGRFGFRTPVRSDVAYCQITFPLVCIFIVAF